MVNKRENFKRIRSSFGHKIPLITFHTMTHFTPCPCNGRIRRGIIEVLTGYCSIIIRICKNSRGTKGPTYACLHPSSPESLSVLNDPDTSSCDCVPIYFVNIRLPHSISPGLVPCCQNIIESNGNRQLSQSSIELPSPLNPNAIAVTISTHSLKILLLAILMRWADEMGWSLVIARATDVQRHRQS